MLLCKAIHVMNAETLRTLESSLTLSPLPYS